MRRPLPLAVAEDEKRGTSSHTESNKSEPKWPRQGKNRNCFLCCSQLFITTWKGPRIGYGTSYIKYHSSQLFP